MSDLLTTSQAAAFLSVTDSCVRRWVLERKLPHVKLGRLLRFERAALEAFVAESRVAPSATHNHPMPSLVSAPSASRKRTPRTTSDLRKRWLERVRDSA